MNLPILYHKAKGGELRQWEVWTVGPHIHTRYGTVGGQLQVSTKTAETKNVGRSNATTPEQQAILEAKSLWQYKVDRKYSESKAGAQEPLNLPMLAHPFEGTKKSKFRFPADAQPKLDGVRCIASRDANGEIDLTSRQGKFWDLPLIAKQLDKWLPEGMVLDGEIYIHGESCQRITSLAKSANPGGKSFKPESAELEYHVYDVPTIEGDDSLPWEDRCIVLNDIRGGGKQITVPTFRVKQEKDLWNIHGEFIAGGYEGAILRADHGQYLWGYRSSELLKVKEFQDGEFRVIDARDGKGKMVGCVVWVCRNNQGEGTFECTMKVPMAERHRMFKERAQYIGKMLTVRYFNLTDDGIPRFPVGIVFRDAIDLPS
jgi:DNA ligase-1